MSHNEFCSFQLKNFQNYLRNNSRNFEIKYLMFDNLLSFARSILLFDLFFYIFHDDNDRYYARDNVQFIDVLKV